MSLSPVRYELLKIQFILIFSDYLFLYSENSVFKKIKKKLIEKGKTLSVNKTLNILFSLKIGTIFII